VIFFLDPDSFKRCYPLLLNEEDQQYIQETWAIYESQGSMDIAKARLKLFLRGREYSESVRLHVGADTDVMFFTF
jgi:hypothetical protein